MLTVISSRHRVNLYHLFHLFYGGLVTTFIDSYQGSLVSNHCQCTIFSLYFYAKSFPLNIRSLFLSESEITTTLQHTQWLSLVYSAKDIAVL